MGGAYLKSNKTYDVTVKDASDTKLTLYTNDQNPIDATVNKKNWATFHKVNLTNDTKISFVKTSYQQGKITRKAINYTRYVAITGNNISFSNINSIEAASQAKTAVLAQQAAQAAAKAQADADAKTAAAAAAQAAANAEITASCTNGSYVNSAGNTVCRPETRSTTPSGATARCSDGSYSYSQSRRGTCSHHGGVSSWL